MKSTLIAITLIFTVLCFAAFIIDEIGGGIVLVPVTVVTAQPPLMNHVEKLGAFTVTTKPDDSVILGSTIRLETGMVTIPQGHLARDIGTCIVGQSAQAAVRLGFFSHRLIEVLYAIC